MLKQEFIFTIAVWVVLCVCTSFAVVLWRKCNVASALGVSIGSAIVGALGTWKAFSYGFETPFLGWVLVAGCLGVLLFLVVGGRLLVILEDPVDAKG